MKILVDVDSVVADFIAAVVGIYDPTLTSINEANRWNWFRDLDKDLVDKIEQELSTYEFWENLPLIKNAQEGIHFLRSQDHDLIWCTMPHRQALGWVDARRCWLNKHFQMEINKEPLITISDGSKYLVKATAMIDDRPDFIEEWERVTNGLGFLFESPMNKDYKLRWDWKKIMDEKFFLRKLM